MRFLISAAVPPPLRARADLSAGMDPPILPRDSHTPGGGRRSGPLPADEPARAPDDTWPHSCLRPAFWPALTSISFREGNVARSPDGGAAQRDRTDCRRGTGPRRGAWTAFGGNIRHRNAVAVCARQVLAAMGDAPEVTWWLLPGNHDHLRDTDPLWESVSGAARGNARPIILEIRPGAVQYDHASVDIVETLCAPRSASRACRKWTPHAPPPRPVSKRSSATARPPRLWKASPQRPSRLSAKRWLEFLNWRAARTDRPSRRLGAPARWRTSRGSRAPHGTSSGSTRQTRRSFLPHSPCQGTSPLRRAVLVPEFALSAGSRRHEGGPPPGTIR